MLILASGSPRRKQLLDELGYVFDVIKPDDSAEDTRCNGENAEDYVCRLALQKAENVAQKVVSGTIVGCDTVAVCNGVILEKPVDVDDARRMLTMLRDSHHSVLSGLCIIGKTDSGVTKNVRFAETQLWMKPVSDEILEAYLRTSAWCGKAGAFGYQDGNDWLQILNGSESNVVGLPVELLKEMLLVPHTIGKNGKRNPLPYQ